MITNINPFRFFHKAKLQNNTFLDKESNHSLLPIIIGVTGHRDLRPEDVPQLEAKVREIFEELIKKYPHTPIQLLSMLAEGADRLVAQIALESGAKLVVPLPMARAEFEQDFKTPESKAEFTRLLAQATVHFELPLAEGITLQKIHDDEASRNQQYARAGAYVASHCQILIALWDGIFTPLVGGTSNVVRFKEGVPELHPKLHNPLDLIDSGPVYHILTPRKSNPQPAGEAFRIYKRFPGCPVDDPEADTAYIRILERIDSFNEDAANLSIENNTVITISKNYLIPDSQVLTLPPICRSILDRYAIADALAIINQRKRRHTMMGLFGLVIFAVVFLTLSHILEFHLLLTLYLSGFGLAFLWHKRAKKRNYQNKHLDYRVLAEGLRVQFFWKLAGIEEDVSEHYLRKERNELEWIRNAIHACNIPVTNEAIVGNNQDKKTAYALVRQYWIDSQQSYFKKATKRDQEKIRRYNGYMKFFLAVGFCIAVILIGNDLFQRIIQEELNLMEPLDSILKIIIHVAPAIAAAFVGYAEKMAFSEQSKLYSRMSSLFTRAQNCLTGYLEENNFEKAEHLFRKLGAEMLVENSDWVLLHRERPMEVPVG
jgi:hypothetical protein